MAASAAMTTRRLYYDDSFQREFTAKLVSCEPTRHGSSAAWRVLLDSTALYPTSGGQPHDIGKLNNANVLDVLDEDDEIIHIADQCVESGTVQGCIDWVRRFDHMQQHTGQHLLSAMFQERYGRPTVSFHLGAELCTIDLHGPEPTEDVLEGAERAANQIIGEDRPVNVRYGTAEQFAEMGVRKQVERSGVLRAIEIEGADLQPCGGTHVKSTAQIGVILVRRCSKIRQDWRVEFVCGRRAARIARQDFSTLRRVAANLSCALEDAPDAAQRAVNERDSNFKSARALLERVAEADATSALQATPPGRDGLRVFTKYFGEDTQAEYLGSFAAQFAKSEKAIALLARSPCGHLIFAQHPSAGKDLNAVLKQVFQQFPGKGGGTRDFVRGRLRDASQGEKAVALAKELVFAK
jgi:alanyl-tRNA synthetase